jgi:hypothetical protein
MVHAHGFDFFNLSLDFVLIALSVWMALTARTMAMGGAVGKTVNLVVAGAIVLGLAHLIETLVANFTTLSFEQNELIHRLIILFGFACLAIGMRSLGQSIGKLKGENKMRK